MARTKQNPNNKSAAQLIDSSISLPPEIMIIIMEILDLNSLLQCRLVSKRWNQMADGVKLKGLSTVAQCSFGRDHCKMGNFSFTNDSINHTCTLLTAKSTKFLSTKFMKSALTRVKKLNFQFVNLVNDSLRNIFESTLPQLNELEQLQINRIQAIKDVTLNLPNLTILSIHEPDDRSKLIVNAPKLSKLKWLGIVSRLELSNKSNITHLAVKKSRLVDSLLYEYDCKFENCQYLYVGSLNLNAFRSIMTHMKPKEIHCDELPYRGSIVDILNVASNHPNLKIYFNNFRVADQEDVNDLDAISRLSNISTQSIIDNYAKLSNVVDRIDDVNYSTLIDSFGGSLPHDFNTRFVSIDRVTVDRIVNDQIALLKFITNRRLLNDLHISNTTIRQSFLDRLPECCPYIINLEIDELGDVSLDSAFIAKLKYLEKYSINHEVSFDLIKTKYKSSPKFQRISCMLNGKRIDFKFQNIGSLTISNESFSGWHNKKQISGFLKELFELSTNPRPKIN